MIRQDKTRILFFQPSASINNALKDEDKLKTSWKQELLIQKSQQSDWILDTFQFTIVGHVKSKNATKMQILNIPSFM